MTLADYLAVVRRRKWLILLALVLTTGSALFFSSRQPKMYRASAQVLLNPDASLINTAGRAAADAQARFDVGQARIARVPAVATKAVQLVGGPAGLSGDRLLADSSVSSDPTSNILTFSVSNRDPALATSLVNAYVDAYGTYSGTQLANRITAAIADVNQQIAALTAKIARVKRHSGRASTLTAELYGLVQQRTNAQQDLNSAGSNGGAQIAPAESAVQTQPNPVRNTALGLLLGLVLGLVIAFIREALDTRVRSSEEIADCTGLTLLARIPTPSKKLRSNNQLAMLTDQANAHAEPYRKLRVALDFANLNAGARSIMITSAVEREGKSTTVANLAVALARAGRRVILVDLDLRRPFVANFFGIDGWVGITDVALGRAAIQDALLPIVVTGRLGIPPTESHNGGVAVSGSLHVLPAGELPPDPAEFLETAVLAEVLVDLGRRADIVLIDSPPLLPVADGVTLAKRVDAMFVVAQAQLLRRPVLGELHRLLQSCQAVKLGFVLTGAETEEVYGYGYGYGHYDGHGHVAGSIESTPSGIES